VGLWRFITRRRAERDLDDEIRFDLGEESRRLIDGGESPESARASARRAFGSITRVKEETREAWGWAGLERLAQDFRFAFRTVRSSPGFALACILTLAVGLGLCSFVFNTLDASLLRPLRGVREPAQLVATQGPVSFPYFERYRDLSGVATSVAAYSGPVPFNLALGNGDATQTERVSGHLVSLEYFSTLGAQPLLGRFFDPGLERRGGVPTAVVSEAFWRTRMNADSSAIGRTVWINRQQATIVGVAGKGFHGLFPITPADLFVPVTADPAVAPELAGNVLDNPAARVFRVFLRLAPGVGMTAAESALDGSARQLDDAYGFSPPNAENTPRRVRLLRADGVAPYPTELRTVVVVFLSAMAALILTFTCANLAGLVLARTSARRHELALRLALGAGRGRLVRQLLAETVLLAVAGGAAGLAATYGFVELLTRVVSDSPLFRLAEQLAPDFRVAALTVFVSAATGVALGLLPALAITGTDLAGGLKAHPGASLTRYRRLGLRNLFVVYQVTAAMTLVVIMGFMISGIRSGASRDPGFSSAGLSVFSLDPARDGYSPEQSARVLADLPERLVEANSVEAAALMDSRLFQQFVLPDRSASIPAADRAGETIQRVAVQSIGPGFFATLGVSIQRGAEFSGRDLAAGVAVDTPLPAVINHTAAELFGHTDSLGTVFRLDERVLQVTGVVNYGLPPPFSASATPTVFLPLTLQDLQLARPQGVAAVVRAHEGDGLERARKALQRLDPNLTTFNARTIGDQLGDLYAVVGYTQAIYGVVGLFALVLASVGLAGVTAHAAMRRRKEIGIRMALGAGSPQVLGLVMREGVIMTALGVSIGFALAYALARLLMAMSSQLGQTIAVGVGNPTRLLAGPAMLIAVTALACYLPARRSAQMNPLVALREE
jgi:predicted permease